MVKGTNVYNADNEELGTVDDIMIDKISGKAIYAIMSFGGFLGIGEKYHPLPWSTLTRSLHGAWAGFASISGVLGACSPPGQRTNRSRVGMPRERGRHGFAASCCPPSFGVRFPTVVSVCVW